MRVAIIGRTEILYETALQLRAAGHLIVCVLTAKEAPEYRRGVEDFRALAEQWGIPFGSSARIREHHDLLEHASADIAVSINYSGVIPEEITALFPLGILNAHGGDLPRYRGNACQAWAILNGEKRIGLCIHRMIGGELDSGDIIGRAYLPLSLDTKVGQVLDWIGNQVPGLFVEVLLRLNSDPSYILERQSKDPRDTLRCYPRRPEDGRIDWRQNALQVLRLINASNKPYPGAFCYYEERKVTIWDAEMIEEFENLCAVPGQITRVGDGFVEVACGDGRLRILSAEYAGKEDVPFTWMRSIRKRLS
jgi:methionyl-tRNA formyltransferase